MATSHSEARLLSEGNGSSAYGCTPRPGAQCAGQSSRSLPGLSCPTVRLSRPHPTMSLAEAGKAHTSPGAEPSPLCPPQCTRDCPSCSQNDIKTDSGSDTGQCQWSNSDLEREVLKECSRNSLIVSSASCHLLFLWEMAIESEGCALEQPLRQKQVSPSVTQVRPPKEPELQHASDGYANPFKSPRRRWAKGRPSREEPGSGEAAAGEVVTKDER